MRRQPDHASRIVLPGDDEADDQSAVYMRCKSGRGILRLEDAAQKDPAQKPLATSVIGSAKSRIVFPCTTSGAYRIIVTAGTDPTTDDFTLEMHSQ
jgi:hypothetical protein